MDDWLAPYRRMWAARLNDLERHLESMTETDQPVESFGPEAATIGPPEGSE